MHATMFTHNTCAECVAWGDCLASCDTCTLLRSLLAQPSGLTLETHWRLTGYSLDTHWTLPGH